MCGRYGRRADKQRIAEWFHTHNTDVFNDEYYEINDISFTPSYNVSPESMQPVVRLDDDTGDRIATVMKWGLVPYWSKNARAKFSSINARADKLASSAAWREPWKHRRCLIPANFFYEWQPLTKEEEKKKVSKPWVVSLPDDRLFAFGGIWDRWKGRDAKGKETILDSFSIITTEPNELLEPFHNRCPLIIEPKDYTRWLEPAQPSHLPIDLVRTWPVEEMRTWRVAKLQGNGPHLLEPYLPDPLAPEPLADSAPSLFKYP
ncbi:MAG TPA: SOS response-associated peptidase [Terracidiphilus sp.]|jgi:putative SOS response-associated peptidase YedK